VSLRRFWVGCRQDRSEGWGFESLRARPGQRPSACSSAGLLLTDLLTAPSSAAEIKAAPHAAPLAGHQRRALPWEGRAAHAGPQHWPPLTHRIFNVRGDTTLPCCTVYSVSNWRPGTSSSLGACCSQDEGCQVHRKSERSLPG
jgi:hypothetical protein